MENNLIFIKVRKRIEEDVMKIEEMINACVSVKGQRKCPLYQDVIDTQIYGLSKEINLIHFHALLHDFSLLWYNSNISKKGECLFWRVHQFRRKAIYVLK